MKRIVVGITGASGIGVGVKLVEHLQRLEDVELHVISSDAAEIVYQAEESKSLADSIDNLSTSSRLITHHDPKNIAASIASGSFHTEGMIIVPCSINTMAKIATCISGDLISRAANVTLKERRRLIIGVRETPFHTLHLEHMTKLSQVGATIMPFIPSFYSKPRTINDLIDQYCGRLMDQLGLENNATYRWGE